MNNSIDKITSNNINEEAKYQNAMAECAAFMAKMIEKYGRDVLDELEAEKKNGESKTKK